MKNLSYGIIICMLMYLSVSICYHSIKADQYQCMVFEKMKIKNRITDMLKTIFAEEDQSVTPLIQSYNDYSSQAKIHAYLFIVLSIALFGYHAFLLWKFKTEHARLLLRNARKISSPIPGTRSSLI